MPIASWNGLETCTGDHGDDEDDDDGDDDDEDDDDDDLLAPVDQGTRPLLQVSLLPLEQPDLLLQPVDLTLIKPIKMLTKFDV